MLSRHKTGKALFFLIAMFFIFLTQPMDQPQQVSAPPAGQITPVVAQCLADIKNCRAIKKSEIKDVRHYSTTLDNGNWITASQSIPSNTYLVLYTIKQKQENQCTPVHGENAFIIFNQLELLFKNN